MAYPVSQKSGVISIGPAVVWNIPRSEKLTKVLTQKGLTKEGELLTWDWAAKVDHVIQSRIYLRYFAKKMLAPSKFYGLLPMQVIDSVISTDAP